MSSTVVMSFSGLAVAGVRNGLPPPEQDLEDRHKEIHYGKLRSRLSAIVLDLSAIDDAKNRGVSRAQPPPRPGRAVGKASPRTALQARPGTAPLPSAPKPPPPKLNLAGIHGGQGGDQASQRPPTSGRATALATGARIFVHQSAATESEWPHPIVHQACVCGKR